MNIAIALSLAGALAVVVGWVTYFAKVYRNATPKRPIGTLALEVGGSLAALGGVVLSFEGGASPGVLVLVPAAFALTMGPLFPALMSQRKTPVGDLKVKVGDQLLAFGATTSAGLPFDSKELMGQRVLFKFFRGAW